MKVPENMLQYFIKQNKMENEKRIKKLKKSKKNRSFI